MLHAMTVYLMSLKISDLLTPRSQEISFIVFQSQIDQVMYVIPTQYYFDYICTQITLKPLPGTIRTETYTCIRNRLTLFFSQGGPLTFNPHCGKFLKMDFSSQYGETHLFFIGAVIKKLLNNNQ